jgi:hypothetical protein
MNGRAGARATSLRYAAIVYVMSATGRSRTPFVHAAARPPRALSEAGIASRNQAEAKTATPISRVAVFIFAVAAGLPTITWTTFLIRLLLKALSLL